MRELWMYMGMFLVCCLGIGLFRVAAQEIKEDFSWKYGAVMIACNLILMIVFCVIYNNEKLQIIKYLILATVLCVCAWTDWKKFLILNKVLLWALLARIVFLAGELLLYNMETWKFLTASSLVAALIFAVGGLLCKAVAPGGVGFGDIKLLFVIGFYAGTDFGIQIIIFTFLVMFVVSLALLLMRKVTRKSVLPFAPFVYLGMLMASLLTGI